MFGLDYYANFWPANCLDRDRLKNLSDLLDLDPIIKVTAWLTLMCAVFE